jgi:transposase
MVYIGIDISSDKFNVCILYPDSSKTIDLSFRQSRKGFEKFRSKLLNIHEDVLIGMESTGVYHMSLYDFLSSNGFEVLLLHPYTLKHFLKAYSHSKTDSVDARAIAIALSQLSNSLRLSNVPSDQLNALKELVRFRNSLVQQRSNLYRRLHNFLRLDMPEVLNFFEADSKVLHALLVRFPTRHDMLSNQQDVVQLLSSFKNWNESKAYSLISALKDSIGLTDTFGSHALIISSITSQLTSLSEQLERIEDKIQQLLSQFPDNPISSIKGVGPVTLAQIISEVGDISRFSSSKAFVAYSGLDPVIHQSGKSYHAGNISKKGNSALRHTFYNLAVRIIRYPGKYRDKYLSLLERGKPKKVAIIAIARKLAVLVYTLWTRGERFDPDISLT